MPLVAMRKSHLLIGAVVSFIAGVILFITSLTLYYPVSECAERAIDPCSDSPTTVELVLLLSGVVLFITGILLGAWLWDHRGD